MKMHSYQVKPGKPYQDNQYDTMNHYEEAHLLFQDPEHPSGRIVIASRNGVNIHEHH